MTGLAITEVRKSFGSVDVIRDVSFEVAEGEFCVFVGPSGCGKSTLLRMVAGLEEATAGTIAIGGEVVNDVDPSERGVAMVFQSYALYPHMTVAENMGFGLKMTGSDPALIKQRVETAARILHLEPLLERKPKQLSGGQRQRVAIGRAIVREPKVFLFDEPLSNLDAELRVQMRLEIAKLHQSLGVTMIYVTHDQVEAMTLADKIVVLRAGQIEQVGAPLELYNDPDSLFVAGFIGSPRMNFLKAEVVGSAEGALTLALPDFDKVTLPIRVQNPPAAEGGPMLLGIRPEHFSPPGNGGDSVEIETTVDVVEHLGGASYAYARSEEERPLTIELRDGRTAAQGAPLKAGFDPARAFLFDEETGRRIR